MTVLAQVWCAATALSLSSLLLVVGVQSGLDLLRRAGLPRPAARVHAGIR